MRIDLPCCSIKTCIHCNFGNCSSQNEYDRCAYPDLLNQIRQLEIENTYLKQMEVQDE